MIKPVNTGNLHRRVWHTANDILIQHGEEGPEFVTGAGDRVDITVNGIELDPIEVYFQAWPHTAYIDSFDARYIKLQNCWMFINLDDPEYQVEIHERE